MAESSSEPAAAELLIEPTLTTETVSKELIVTTVTEGSGRTLGSDTGAKVPSSNGDADSPLPSKEEATPTPQESSLVSSENGTVTTVTTEEESVSALLRHIGTEGRQNRAGDPGLELDLEEVVYRRFRNGFREGTTPKPRRAAVAASSSS